MVCLGLSNPCFDPQDVDLSNVLASRSMHCGLIEYTSQGAGCVVRVCCGLEWDGSGW